MQKNISGVQVDLELIQNIAQEITETVEKIGVIVVENELPCFEYGFHSSPQHFCWKADIHFHQDAKFQFTARCHLKNLNINWIRQKLEKLEQTVEIMTK
jgi:hypothetical protein